MDSYVHGTCLGHKIETKTVHITSSSLDIFNWKPNSHPNVKGSWGRGSEDRGKILIMIYLTNVLPPREAR